MRAGTRPTRMTRSDNCCRASGREANTGRWDAMETLLFLFNPFPDVATLNFYLMKSLLATSFESRSVSAERVGQGEVGGCTWRVHTVRPSLDPALETPWLALGGPLLSSYAWTGWENCPLALHNAHFLQASFFPSLASDYWPTAVTIASLLMGGCGLSHKHVEDGCKSICVKFGIENQT